MVLKSRLQRDEVRSRANYVPNNSVQVTEFCLRDGVKVTTVRMFSSKEKTKSGYKSPIAGKDLEQNANWNKPTPAKGPLQVPVLVMLNVHVLLRSSESVV